MNCWILICFWRKLMLAVSQHQWDQWEIFLLSSDKTDAENSIVLADSKFISTPRQSKQETQFTEICLETQKAISEKEKRCSCIFSPSIYNPIETPAVKWWTSLFLAFQLFFLIIVQTFDVILFLSLWLIFTHSTNTHYTIRKYFELISEIKCTSGCQHLFKKCYLLWKPFGEKKQKSHW